jgi:hypothetical protein
VHIKVVKRTTMDKRLWFFLTMFSTSVIKTSSHQIFFPFFCLLKERHFSTQEHQIIYLYTTYFTCVQAICSGFLMDIWSQYPRIGSHPTRHLFGSWAPTLPRWCAPGAHTHDAPQVLSRLAPHPPPLGPIICIYKKTLFSKKKNLSN